MRNALAGANRPTTHGPARDVWVREKGLPRRRIVSDAPPRCILLAVDLSAPGGVEERAMELAARSAARLCILGVVPGNGPASRMQRQRLWGIVDRARARGIASRGEVAVGDPRRVIGEAAGSRSVDVVVVGRGDWAGSAAAGSVCGHLVREAPCSVLVVGGAE